MQSKSNSSSSAKRRAQRYKAHDVNLNNPVNLSVNQQYKSGELKTNVGDTRSKENLY